MAGNDNTNTHSNKSQSLPPICNHFNKGTCKFGDRCKFIHDHRNRSGLNLTNNTGTTNDNTWGYIGRAFLNSNQHQVWAPPGFYSNRLDQHNLQPAYQPTLYHQQPSNYASPNTSAAQCVYPAQQHQRYQIAQYPQPATPASILGPAPVAYPSQVTTLPSAFSTMTVPDPTWNMDTVILFPSPIPAIALFLPSTWSKRKKRLDAEREGLLITFQLTTSQNGSIDVPLYSLSKVSRATDNFSVDNKLGEGGFGPVYKGVLEGQQIAVKRLSKSSRQGLDEFENEVICIAKLQHRNLVKLLGYCIEGDERMLLYEYMPNKSLDTFIFDGIRKSLLDWPQRFHIINGIARGLLYLHQDSRLKVVHRDLKAGNILLDHQMRPKISDFGLARMFKEHESEANTKRVVGTLGYISPEYAVNGLFSVKSDIFSFGVLVLEIVSGKKNRGFVHEKHHDHLLGHAWRLCKEGKSLDLLDECLGNSYSVSEVLRSVHIGLLCVQQRAEDRPCTPSVVAMLGGEGSLPFPKQPGFFIQGSDIYSPSRLRSLPSVNGVTLTEIDGR